MRFDWLTAVNYCTISAWNLTQDKDDIKDVTSLLNYHSDHVKAHYSEPPRKVKLYL